MTIFENKEEVIETNGYKVINHERTSGEGNLGDAIATEGIDRLR